MGKFLIAAAAAAFAALSAAGAGARLEEVQVSAAEITVSPESVTVDAGSLTRPAAAAEPLSEVAKPLAAAERKLDGAVAERERLVREVRGGGDAAKRVAALGRVWHQDDVYWLFLKPGEDKCVEVRLAALGRIAEVDLVRKIASSVKIPQVAAAARRRLAEIYGDAEAGLAAGAGSSVPRDYARRLLGRRPAK